MEPIRLIIADDHQLMIDGIKTALSDCSEVKIIGEASNGNEVIEIVKTNKPDVILLDIRMPKMDGIEAAKILKKQFRDVKIIILSQYGEKGFIRRCQQIGVEGYLLKDCGKGELIKTINHVYNGGVFFNISNTDTDNEYASTFRNLDSLVSNRELETLKLLVKDFTVDQIAVELDIEVSTIKTYKQRLKQKSGTNTLSGLISWAYQNRII